MNKHERRAYEAGVRAEEMGGLLMDCPFEDGELRDAWRAGYAASRTARAIPDGVVAQLHRKRSTRHFA